METVAEQAGVSRASVYQYFRSKVEIFAELARILDEELWRLVRRLGPLGPTEFGLENLHWWLGEFAYLQEDFAAVFLLWPTVLPEKPPLFGCGSRFRKELTVTLAARTDQAGCDNAGDPEALILAVLAMTERIGQFQYVSAALERRALALLALTVQCTLFPGTPPAVICQFARRAGSA